MCNQLGYALWPYWSHKYYKKLEACLNCVGDHRSSREAPCDLEKKCINCSINCMILTILQTVIAQFLRSMEITRVKAFDNLPFLEAK